MAFYNYWLEYDCAVVVEAELSFGLIAIVVVCIYVAEILLWANVIDPFLLALG